MFHSVAILLAAAPAAFQASFSDQTQSCGISFTHALDLANFGNPMVAGGAIGDFDHNGWPDVFLLGGGGRPDALYFNYGGSFQDEASTWGVNALHHGAGASAADFDGDGWCDLYVTSHGIAGAPPAPGQHRLYRNTGSGFVDVAVAAGVSWTGNGAPDGYGSAWGDYDRDGDLDLYVGGWELGNSGNHLFRNEGNGVFTDVSVASETKQSASKCFDPGFADMDGDLWPELIMIADGGTSRYLINDGDGSFTRLLPNPSGFTTLNGMGLAIADFDRDGKLDFYGTSIWFGSQGTGNALWWNLGSHQYLESGFASGVADGAWGWGTLALDCELDGRLDLAETNGWNGPAFLNQPCRLFVNQGARLFHEQAAAAGITQNGEGRTLLRLDYDRDGDEDLLVLSNQDAAVLYRNDAGSAQNHWLKLKLDTSAHAGLAPEGIGTRAIVRDGSRTLMRYLDGTPSHLGTSERVLTFGLGARASLDELRLTWSDGSVTALGPMSADHELAIASGLPLAWSAPPQRGAALDLVLTGAAPGEYVNFYSAKNGAGPGPTLAGYGTLRLDLRTPVSLGGGTLADAQGRAALPVRIPAGAPLIELGVQAVIARGPGGADSVKSNAVLATVRP